MRYTARKILTLLVTMLVVSLLTFAAFDMISGDPAATLLGTQATPEKVEALRTEMGLNRPMLVRYGEWLAGFFTGNLGVSFQYRQPVQALLGPKMLVTLCLSLVSFVLIVVVSLPLGLLSANGKLEGLHTFLNQFCMAVPPFFTGILISWCFGIFLRVFVPGDFPGLDRNLGKSLVYLFFAAVSIAIPRVAMTVRMLRSTVISEMNKPYVRTAIAGAVGPCVEKLSGAHRHVFGTDHGGDRGGQHRGGAGVLCSWTGADAGGLHFQSGLPCGGGHRGDPGLLGGAFRHSGGSGQSLHRPPDGRDRQMKKRNPYLTAGLVMTGILTALIVMGVFWTPYDPNAMAAGPKLTGPSLAHLMGTDSFGRDIFSRVLKGAGTTYGIALCTVAVGAVCGTVLGAVTGYFGGIVDDVLMRLGDVLTAFPSILLALVVISLLGPGKTGNVILALGLVFIPSFARMARGTYAGLREVNYVKSARLMGASSSRILWRHILPNTWSVLLPALTIGFNNAVLAEASMSYLCIGVTPPDASLGYMLSESQGMFMSAPWYALGTGLTLVWMVFGVGLIGEGLQRRGGGEV